MRLKHEWSRGGEPSKPRE